MRMSDSAIASSRATARSLGDLVMKLRSAMLARTRPEPREYELGEGVYYLRVAGERTLEKCRWRGAAMVVCNEPGINCEDGRASEKVESTGVHCRGVARNNSDQSFRRMPRSARRRSQRWSRRGCLSSARPRTSAACMA